MSPSLADVVTLDGLDDACAVLSVAAAAVRCADPDAAFDLAKEADLERYGTHSPVASLASVDADALSVSDQAPLPLTAATTSALSRALATPDVLHALPMASDRRFSRRRLRLLSDDVSVALPLEPGPLLARDADLEALIASLLEADAGSPLAPTEILDAVELVRVRARHRPTTTRYPAPSARAHVLVDTQGRIVAVHPNLAEARRDAVARARLDAGAWSIFSLAGRSHDGTATPSDTPSDSAPSDAAPTLALPRPLVTVERSLVARRATFKVTLVTPKVDPLPVEGWVFALRPQ